MFNLVNFGMKITAMEYGICLLPVVPLRREPNDRSEMLTQLLFGETVRIFERKQKWISVETDLDGYPGWLDAKQVEPLDEKEYDRIRRSSIILTDELLSPISDAEGNAVNIPLSSCLPGLKNGVIKVGSREYRCSGSYRTFEKGTVEGVMQAARLFMNAPYLWGGKTILGMDCSGLTQVAFRMNGISLPRDAKQQAGVGEQVNFLSESHQGDLAFFDNPEGEIVHVGLLLDTQTILHASGKVRVDTLDHNGIYDEEKKSYSHRLRIIRRIIP